MIQQAIAAADEQEALTASEPAAAGMEGVEGAEGAPPGADDDAVERVKRELAALEREQEELASGALPKFQEGVRQLENKEQDGEKLANHRKELRIAFIEEIFKAAKQQCDNELEEDILQLKVKTLESVRKKMETLLSGKGRAKKKGRGKSMPRPGDGQPRGRVGLSSLQIVDFKMTESEVMADIDAIYKNWDRLARTVKKSHEMGGRGRR